MGAQPTAVPPQQSFTPPTTPPQQNTGPVLQQPSIPQVPAQPVYSPAPEYVPGAFEGTYQLPPFQQAAVPAQQPNTLPAGQPNAQSSFEQQLAALTQQVSQLGQVPQQQQSNPELQQLLQLMKQQYQRQNDPGYLDMDYNQFISVVNGDAEAGKPSQLQAVLKYVHERAVQEALDKFRQEYAPLEGQLEATRRQLGMIMAASEVRRLEESYKTQDPYFSENMHEAGKFLASDIGQKLIAENPEVANNSIEYAYRLQVAKRLGDPAFQQRLAQQVNQQIQPQQQQPDLYKMQGGFAPGAQMAQAPAAQQPAITNGQYGGPASPETDQNVVARIMSFSHMI